jgi:hypothetical protein
MVFQEIKIAKCLAKVIIQKREEPPKQPLSLLFLLFLLWLCKELIASPAPACSQDLFSLLHFEFALTFQLSISGFTHDFTLFLFGIDFRFCLLLSAFLALSSSAAGPKISIS